MPISAIWIRMAHIITEITSFDNKRNKVTLDYGEVTFLLYKGECRKLGIKLPVAGHNPQRLYGKCAFDDVGLSMDGSKCADNEEPAELSDALYRSIIEDILLPRAKKRVLYYLKNADKTREQIRRKLREGYYPDEVIAETFRFLDRYGFADDDRYAEQYVEELKGSKSRREISLKLKERGIPRDRAEAIIAELDDEDEYAACEKALKKKYLRGVGREDRQKAYAYLARRGFSYDAIDQAIRSQTDTNDDVYLS